MSCIGACAADSYTPHPHVQTALDRTVLDEPLGDGLAFGGFIFVSLMSIITCFVIVR